MDKSLAKNAGFNILYKLLNVLFPLVTSSYTARVLLADGVGKVSYAQTIASYFILGAALGIPAYGVKAIAESKKAKNSIEISETFSTLITILWVSTLIFSVGYLLLIFNAPSFKTEKLLYLAVGLQVFLVSCNVDWFYQGMEEYGYITIRSFVVKCVSLIAILLFVKTRDDYIVYALISSLAVAGNYLFNIFHIRKYVRFAAKGIRCSKHIKSVIILLMSTIAIELYSKVDVTMLGIMTDNTSVGYYSNAVKIINVVVLAITAITGVFLPRLSSYYKEDNKKFTKLVNQGAQIIIFIALPVSVGLFLVSKEFIQIMFGIDFLPAYTTLRILSPLVFVKGVGDLFCDQAVISVGKEKYFLITNTTAAILNIILNYNLIPTMGRDGAAIASLSSELVVNIGMFILINKYIHLKWERNIYLPTICSMIVMTLVVTIVRNMNLSIYVTFIAEVIIGAGSYLLMNVILRNSLLSFIYKK